MCAGLSTGQPRRHLDKRAMTIHPRRPMRCAPVYHSRLRACGRRHRPRTEARFALTPRAISQAGGIDSGDGSDAQLVQHGRRPSRRCIMDEEVRGRRCDWRGGGRSKKPPTVFDSRRFGRHRHVVVSVRKILGRREATSAGAASYESYRVSPSGHRRLITLCRLLLSMLPS